MFTKRLERMYRPPADLNKYENEPYTKNPLLKFRLKDVYEQRHIMFLQQRAAEWKLKTCRERELPRRLEERRLPQWHYADNLRRSARKIKTKIPRMLRHVEQKIITYGCIKYKNRYPEIIESYMGAVHEHFNQLMYTYSLQTLLKRPELENPEAEPESFALERKDFRFKRAGRTENYGKFLERQRCLSRQLLLTELPVRYVLNSSEMELPPTICNFEYTFSTHGQLSVQGIGGRNAGSYRAVHKYVRNGIEKLTTHLRWTWYPKVVGTLKKMYRRRTISPKKWNRVFNCLEGLINRQINNMKQATLVKLLNVVSDPRRLPMLSLSLECRTAEHDIDINPSLKVIIEMYCSIVYELMEVGKKLEPLPPQVNTNLIGYPIAHLKVEMSEIFVKEFLIELRRALRKTYEPVMTYVENFKAKYNGLCAKQVSDDLNEFLRVPHNFDEYFAKIDVYFKYIRMLLSEPRHDYFEMAVVNSEAAVKTLRQTADTFVKRIVEHVVREHMRAMEEICADFQIIKERAYEVPKSTEELLESAEYMVLVKKEKIDELRERILYVMEVGNNLVELTEMHQYHLELTITTINWLQEITEIIDFNASQQEQFKFVFEEHLQDVVKKLNADIVALIPKLSIIDEMSDPTKFRDSYILLQNIIDQLKVFDVYVHWANKEEKLFKIPQTTYPTLEVLKDFVYPFAALIKLCIDWLRYYNVWMDGPFEYLEPTFVEQTTEKYFKEFQSNQKYYRNKIKQDLIDQPVCKFRGQTEDPDPEKHPVPLRLCNKMITSIKDFTTGVSVVRIMCNPALRKRHWKEMSEIAGFNMMPDAGTTLRKILSIGLENKLDQFEIISISANKEKQLHDNLINMIREWDACTFPVGSYKETGVIILNSLEDIQALLDDHILKTLSMRGSAFMKPCEDEVLSWYEKIMRVNKTLEEWSKVQSSFLYLLPIFSSDDIVAQMPEEGCLFKRVEEIFNANMAKVLLKPLVIETAPAAGLLESLQHAVQLLDDIANGVCNYLERKRLVFPRFFFLSNDEMLEILSETKDPLRVQPHLNKCFEGIFRLQFDDGKNVLALLSAENEKIEFFEGISTAAAGGSVERWLVAVEDEMFRAVRSETELSYADYPNTKRESWALKWPQMVVLCVSQIYWAAEVHIKLRKSTEDATAMTNFVGELDVALRDLVALIRTSDINNLNRIVVKSLIVVDVHAKDVIAELIKLGIHSEFDFQWMAHLRYYWEEGQNWVRIINATVAYANEYLGNSERLVITPLTDRCYRTLIAAYQQHLNGAPEGPAGTGKTETIKDLAKALAVQCKVFNCSDGLDYKAMGKFFKGLASCGAWACFDEFNRIELEVLSVVAQQIMQILQAVRATVPRFTFEGTDIKLNPACYICITGNPGYAGRCELPDNLRVLFRAVAMMVPDYALIGEISLYSHGFNEARKLSAKIVTTYRLCSEQLSMQSHYDYGMRAVKSVLTACGNLKSQFPDECEDNILLRSLLDVNLPKFMSFDIPLFEGIVSDIFPGLSLPKADYSHIEREFKMLCEKLVLEPTQNFLTKVVQTFEMMTVRHGFMLIGEPMAGKSKTLQILANILEALAETAAEVSPYFRRVDMTIFNPKSITLTQLFGHFDSVSYEWSDGLVSNIFRQYATKATPNRKWIIFDGPVDAGWVENINTVLDDNKKLCLTSGEVISMTKEMSIIFEVMDLAKASPATVSRCGMIFMEPASLGWKSLASSWLKKCDARWADAENSSYVMLLFEWLLEPCQTFIRKHCHQHISPGDFNAMTTTFDIFEILLHEAIDENLEEYSKFLSIYFQAALIYSLVWGVAGILDLASREKFDGFLRDLWSNSEEAQAHGLGKLEISLPSEGLVVDYVYIFKQRGSWKSWHELVKRMEIEVSPLGVQVPTIDTARYLHLLEMHTKYRKRMLFVGPSGTGKSAYIQNYLMNKLDSELYETSFMTFTVMMTANQTQDLLISKLFKRKRGVYGPPKGKTGVLFVDDMNMPIKEKYGAQPPLELLRQYFDYGYVYDLKECSKIIIQDLTVVSACGLPGGSRQNVYSRFLNHFNIFSVNGFATDTVNRIFVSVLLHGFKRSGHGNDVAAVTNQIVCATQEIYKDVQSQLRATPLKSHYIFNVRDIARVVTGCALLKKESVSDKRVFVRLWYHEALRVFYDRLTSEEDRNWMLEKFNQCVEVHFKDKVENVFENYVTEENPDFTMERANQIFFGVYFDEENAPDDRRYEEVSSLDAILNVATRSLADYNSTRRSKIDITLFEYAIQHLSRICRVISIPGASALLIGMGGSGRQSLTKLAAHIVQTSFFQPEIVKNYGAFEWHNDIKKVLKEAGGFNKHSVFLLTETQIKTELFLQDIDCLLNQGEVPNIYAIDEKQEILELVRLTAQGGNRNVDISPLQVFLFFVNRCKQKMHIVLCLSPIGNSLRTRVRLYPSLVNCCTIDWYQSWPEEALQMIAKLSFENINLPTDELRQSIVETSQYFHTSAEDMIRKFCHHTGRHIYQTNASFLELIKSFQCIIARKQKEVMDAKMRYIAGLDTLANAESAISQMQSELNALQPKLVQLAENSRQMLIEINTETIAASVAAEQVKKDEIVAGIQAQAAQELKNECEKDLAQAIPVLEDAIQALNTLKPADITLVKSMKNPPSVIKLVMAAVCVIKGIPPDRIADTATGKMINDYWGPSKRILGDMNFLQTLKDFDKDNINLETMKKIRKDFIPNKDFHPKIVAKASSAAEGLCKWIIAMDLYDNVAKIVAPKKAKLAAAEKEYADTMCILEEKRVMVALLEEKVAKLNDELRRANAEMKRTQDESDFCQSRLLRAEALIASLGGEKERWTDAAEALQAVYNNLPGDVLLSCGIIAYLSAVNLNFRNKCVNEWLEKCKSSDIPHTLEYDISHTLCNEVTIQKWNIKGLPKDVFSIENAIIGDNSSRFSLFIDPQGQANNWIKNMEQENRLVSVKFNQRNYMRTIAEAIERGYPVIIENVLEEIEAPLDPILNRKIFVQGEKQFISLGDNVIPYSESFRLYMTCNMRNPHFMPETFNKVTIINFVLTQGALEDQLLSIVVSKERPDLQELRMSLIAEAAKNKAALIEAENMILRTLSASEGDILENEAAIRTLNDSKILSQNLVKKQSASVQTEQKIEAFRLNYKPVATHSAVLYYSVTELPNIDPMYQFSLRWYMTLYQKSIDAANKSKDLPRRVKFLVDGITRNLYDNVCRSIFEKDKLLFSFILTCRILLSSGQIEMKHLANLLTNAKETNGGPVYENPDTSWIDQKTWLNICRLEEFKELGGFVESLIQNLCSWKYIFDHADPETLELPAPWRDRTTRFEKLMILKALRPDKIFLAVRKFIGDEMGEQYVSPPEFDIGKSYAESNALTPLVFVLSAGADPLGALMKFAEKMGKDDTFECISLGQGQGAVAQTMIKHAQETGTWMCLQNCHLALSWMPTLEYLWENMDTFNTAASFRLWLTSYPSQLFPIALLQNGVKMTNESPTGLKENIMRSYNSEPINDVFFYAGCPKQDRAFTRLLFGICFFHAVVQERCKYGSLGWNIPYGFNESDLQISVSQLSMLLNQYDHVPYDALLYLIAECNYGGRVTDTWDRRAIVTILADYINSRAVSEPRFNFANDDRYILPRKSEHREVLRYVETTIPTLAHPEVFGLHANSGITRDLQTTTTLLNSMISLLGSESISTNGGTENVDDVVNSAIDEIISNFPNNLDIETAKLKYPIAYTESMNTVLVQEMERFQELQLEIRQSCQNIRMAMQGYIVMTPDLENISSAIQLQRVPLQWMSKSYPTLKPLGSYIQDLFKRIRWLKTWFEMGKPSTFWLSGFYFPQAFLTGALQNFARKHKLPIDGLTFDFEVLQVQSVESPPEDGVYVNGLYIEGARWNWEEVHIDEQFPKVLVYSMPTIYLKPIENAKLSEGTRYKCPLYKTAERRGILSTTGHSSNYVIPFLVNTKKDPAHWIKRSAALICQTSD